MSEPQAQYNVKQTPSNKNYGVVSQFDIDNDSEPVGDVWTDIPSLEEESYMEPPPDYSQSNDDYNPSPSEFCVRWYAHDDKPRNIHYRLFDSVGGNDGSSRLRFQAFGLTYREDFDCGMSKMPMSFMPSLQERNEQNHAPRLMHVYMHDEDVTDDKRYEVKPAFVNITNLLDEGLIVQTFTQYADDRLIDYDYNNPVHLMFEHPFYLVGVEDMLGPSTSGVERIAQHRDFPIYPNKHYVFRLIKTSYIQRELDLISKEKVIPYLDDLIHYVL